MEHNPAKPARIWLSIPHLTGQEGPQLQALLASGWVTPAGPALTEFERALAAACGVPHAVALNSGTAGLHLALQLAGVGPGHTVLCSALSFVASANAVRYLGAEPIFIDSEATTWNMSPEWLEVALKQETAAGRRPRAVLVTHLYGRVADMPSIVQLCDTYKVTLVEDAAEAVGARLNGKMGGSWAKLGVYSFNGNKIITTGGGGALVTADAELATQALYLATQARQPTSHYEHTELGYNYRMSGVLAAVGLAQLAVLPNRIERRRYNHAYYKSRLGKLPGATLHTEREGAEDTCWLTTLLLAANAPASLTRDGLLAALAAANIEARPVWKPLHQQPFYADRPFYGDGLCTKLFNKGICLPSSSLLTDEALNRVCAVVEDAWQAQG